MHERRLIRDMSKGSNIVHMLGSAAGSVRDNLGTTVVTALTVGFSLAILTQFLFVFINLDAAVSTWGDRTHVVVYIKDTAMRGPGSIERIKGASLAVPGVKSVAYISKDDAYAEIKAEMKGHEAVLEGVDAGALPASIELRLDPGYMEGAKAAEVVERFKRMDWAEEVQYSREWVEKFAAFLRFFEVAAFGAGLFLVGVTVFIVSNTVRLTVYARQDEIEIMSLVGATDNYIKLPFFIEGVLQGLIGGVLAVFIIYAGRWALLARMPVYLQFIVDVPVSWTTAVAAVFVFGIALGAAGSLLSTSRFLRSC